MKLYSLKIKDTAFRVAVVTGKEEMKKGITKNIFRCAARAAKQSLD